MHEISILVNHINILVNSCAICIHVNIIASFLNLIQDKNVLNKKIKCVLFLCGTLEDFIFNEMSGSEND